MERKVTETSPLLWTPRKRNPPILQFFSPWTLSNSSKLLLTALVLTCVFLVAVVMTQANPLSLMTLNSPNLTALPITVQPDGSFGGSARVQLDSIPVLILVNGTVVKLSAEDNQRQAEVAFYGVHVNGPSQVHCRLASSFHCSPDGQVAIRIVQAMHYQNPAQGGLSSKFASSIHARTSATSASTSEGADNTGNSNRMTAAPDVTNVPVFKGSPPEVNELTRTVLRQYDVRLWMVDQTGAQMACLDGCQDNGRFTAHDSVDPQQLAKMKQAAASGFSAAKPAGSPASIAAPTQQQQQQGQSSASASSHFRWESIPFVAKRNNAPQSAPKGSPSNLGLSSSNIIIADTNGHKAKGIEIDGGGPNIDIEPAIEIQPGINNGSCVNERDLRTLLRCRDVRMVLDKCFARDSDRVSGCIVDTLGLTPSCAHCFADATRCGLLLCSSICILDSDVACTACLTRRCQADLVQCSGIASNSLPFPL